jgi:hypothetical protein
LRIGFRITLLSLEIFQKDFNITGFNGFGLATWNTVTNTTALGAMRYGEERRVLISLAARGREFAVAVLILQKNKDCMPFVTNTVWANYSLFPIDPGATIMDISDGKLVKSIEFGKGWFFVNIQHERLLGKDIYFVNFKMGDSASSQHLGMIEEFRDRVWQLKPVSRDRFLFGSSLAIPTIIGLGFGYVSASFFRSKK